MCRGRGVSEGLEKKHAERGVKQGRAILLEKIILN